MDRVFGVAGKPTGKGFLLSSAAGEIASIGAEPGSELEAYSLKLAASWDNHITALG